MFLVVTGPMLTGIALVVVMCGRRRRFLPALFILPPAFLVSWFFYGANVHDGDMPAFIGFMWGCRILPWLTVPAILAPFFAVWLPQRTLTPGFEVLPRPQKDVGC
jgi:hypothetical protein